MMERWKMGEGWNDGRGGRDEGGTEAEMMGGLREGQGGVQKKKKNLKIPQTGHQMDSVCVAVRLSPNRNKDLRAQLSQRDA